MGDRRLWVCACSFVCACVTVGVCECASVRASVGEKATAKKVEQKFAMIFSAKMCSFWGLEN